MLRYEASVFDMHWSLALPNCKCANRSFAIAQDDNGL